jgi:hypothetical protein
MSTTNEFISAFDVERNVQDLRKFSLEEVGSAKWMNQHEVIEALNMQVTVVDSGTQEFSCYV